jgi:hypothetical protein
MSTRQWAEMLQEITRGEHIGCHLGGRPRGEFDPHTLNSVERRSADLVANTRWETAHTALFLISHDSSYVSGTIINMDAGMSTGSDGRIRRDASQEVGEKGKL